MDAVLPTTPTWAPPPSSSVFGVLSFTGVVQPRTTVPPPPYPWAPPPSPGNYPSSTLLTTSSSANSGETAAPLPRTARRPPRNGVPFSQADSLLLLRFDSQGVKRKDMAERLGRTLGSINGHLHRLKKGKVDLNVVDEEEEGATEVAASGGEASSSWESSENESEEEEAPEDDYEQPSEPRRRRSVTASKPRTRPSARSDSTSCTPRVRYTPADDLKLVKLYRTGQKWPEIGEALGRTAASVGGRYRYLEQTGKLPKVGRRTAG